MRKKEIIHRALSLFLACVIFFGTIFSSGNLFAEGVDRVQRLLNLKLKMKMVILYHQIMYMGIIINLDWKWIGMRVPMGRH